MESLHAGDNNKALDKDLKNVEQTSCKSERLDRLKKVIKAMDKDQNGHLCPDELAKGRIRPERHSCSSFFESTISSCDLDSSGKIAMDEFCNRIDEAFTRAEGGDMSGLGSRVNKMKDILMKWRLWRNNTSYP